MSTAVISSDSHFVEPPDLWQKRLDKKLRDRAPRVVRGIDGRKGDFIVAEGLEPIPIAIFLGAGVKPDVYAQLIEQGYDACPKSVWEPSERVKDQDRDGVIAEVIYGSVGLKLFSLEDDELRFACCKAFNDWALEYCSEDRKRLIPLGMLTLEDIPAAVKELEKLGARTVDIGLPNQHLSVYYGLLVHLLFAPSSQYMVSWVMSCRHCLD